MKKSSQTEKTSSKIMAKTSQKEAPYRIYSDEEIDTFLADDQLSSQLKKRLFRASRIK